MDNLKLIYITGRVVEGAVDLTKVIRYIRRDTINRIRSYTWGFPERFEFFEEVSTTPVKTCTQKLVPLYLFLRLISI